VRIVGGEFRGRGLAAPRTRDIRPTSDRLRQTMFDILTHGYGDCVNGARVLDLFAGTGALGLEALSRGAEHTLFVEEGVEARGLIRGNIETLGLTGRTRILRRDASDLGFAGTIAPFDLVFVDPPYGRGLGARALVAALAGSWIKTSAICALEESAKDALDTIAGFEELERRLVGDSQLIFFQPASG
jgi:16S rRNA (guanine966-N2)-methyltransferase